PESDNVMFVGLLLSFGAKTAKSERYSVDKEDFESLRYGVVYGIYGSRCFQNLFEIAKENDEIAAAISEILDAFSDPMEKELPSLLQDDERYCTYNKEFLTTTTSIQSLTEKE
ncbi:9263_t:CDS:2, partial [Paraglomus brasilianum]